MASSKTLFFALALLAAVGLCHGDKPDEKWLYNKLFSIGQEDMTPSETLKNLKILQDVTDDIHLKEDIKVLLDVTDIGTDKCSFEHYEKMRKLYEQTEYAKSLARGTGVSNVAESIKAKSIELHDLCFEEYRTKLVEGTSSLTKTELEDIYDLARNVEKKDASYENSETVAFYRDLFLQQLVKYVEKRAGKESLYSKSWRKMRLDKAKFRQAFDKFITVPCDKFHTSLEPTVRIGKSLISIKNFDISDIFLFKADEICSSITKSFDDCFKVLSKMQGKQ